MRPLSSPSPPPHTHSVVHFDKTPPAGGGRQVKLHLRPHVAHCRSNQSSVPTAGSMLRVADKIWAVRNGRGHVLAW